MLDEVYNYGSFRQSKMFVSGVTCGDCHEPHSQKLRAPGEGVCLQCHAADKYASPKHSFHETASPALGCASCHMPVQTYMVVDPRHDHSFRIPRPDLSAKLGTPNACNDCHKDKTPDWAAAAVERWYGPARKGFQRFGEAFHAARQERAEARNLLYGVATDPLAPGIARATAYAELGAYIGADLIPEMRRALSDPDPLARLGALRAIEAIAQDQRWPLANRLLDDPVRAVRIQAASILAATPMARLSPEDRTRFERAAKDYIEVQRFNADRPEARTNLGAFLARRGQAAEAEAEYRAAIRLSPAFVPAYVNLADLYRSQGRDIDGEIVLRDAIKLAADDAAAHHALGLLLVRVGRGAEALTMLAMAAEREPRRARYTYVYAIALSSAGRRVDAIRALEENHERHPIDRDTLIALVSLHREQGDRAAALRFAERLARLAPGDPGVARLIDELRRPAAP
jgi:predicted CXXCH cytochrome family protein